MSIQTIDQFYWELMLMELHLSDRAYEMELQANIALDDQVRLMALRDDYEWFRNEMVLLYPTGLQDDEDERRIYRIAQNAGMLHIVDALIDELSLKGAGIALALLDRSLA